jgi:hypothetical protein
MRAASAAALLAALSCGLPPDAILCYYACDAAGRVLAERSSVRCDLRVRDAQASCGIRDGDVCAALRPPCDALPGCEEVRLVLCAAKESALDCTRLAACRTRGLVVRLVP